MLTPMLTKSCDDVDVAESDLIQGLEALNLNPYQGSLTTPIPLRSSGRSLPALQENNNAQNTRTPSMIKLLGNYQHAVFLFSDITNFATLSQLPAHQFVATLNPIFTGLELIVKQQGESADIKIVKWESNCLMLCGSNNALVEESKNQVKAILNIAHAFSQFMFTYNKTITGHSVDFRFGIHVGCASKTQVRFKDSLGEERWVVDWFGEAVNKASRMESSSHPYQAQVSEDVYRFSQKYFEFTEAHARPVKSFGEVSTRFLIKPIDNSSQSEKKFNEGSSSSEFPRKTSLRNVPVDQKHAGRSVSGNMTTLVRRNVKSQPALTQDDSAAIFLKPQRTLLMSAEADPMIKILGEYKNAVILFADIKGFTVLSQQMTSCELVMRLDPIYSAFERIIDQYGTPKGIKIVKWQGDCIMLSGSSRVESADEIHKQATTMIHIGYLLSQFMSDYNKTVDTETFNFRFGISIGEATKLRIRYKQPNGEIHENIDWIGEAVTKASKMESSSHPNQVQVTEEIAVIARDNFDFTEPQIRSLQHGAIPTQITTRFLYSPSKAFKKEKTENLHPQASSSSTSSTRSRKSLGSYRSSSSNK